MKNTIKQISLMVLGGAAWMVCAVVLPMNQAANTDGLMAEVSSLVISQAYADDDKSKSDDEDKSDDKSKSDDESKSEDESSSTSYDFSSDTLICVSRTSVETTLNISSESSDGKSSDKDDDKSESDDDDKSSDKDDDKSSANESDSLMAKVFSLVISSAYAEDDKSKSDDDGKSDDDDKSSDKGDSESSDSSSSTVTSSDIDALATCTAVGQDGTAPGVWVPSTAVGDSDALTAYIQEVQAGGSSTPSRPESSMKSYRVIRGE